MKSHEITELTTQAAAEAEDMAAKSNSNGNGNAGATVVQVVSSASGPAGAPGRTIQVRARVEMIGA